MSTRILHQSLLASALLAAAGIVSAQSTGTAQAKATSTEAMASASGEANAARDVAREAREAAVEAARTSEGVAATPEGQAQARYQAYVADRASRQAQASAADARESVNDVGAARSAAFGGTAQPEAVAVEARVHQRRTENASLAAQQASAEAVAAARAASEAMTAPPPPPPAPAAPMAVNDPLVTFRSHNTNPSIVAASQAFTRLDRDGDGVIVRAEADATLAGSFDAIDTNRNGQLDRDEYTATAR